MAEINLLGNSQNQKSQGLSGYVPLLNKIFAGLLVLVLAVYGWFVYQSGRVDAEMGQINDAVNATQQSLLRDPDRNELLTRQGQIQDLARLAKNHFYWSVLLKELPKMDLKTAQLLSFNANSAGMATMVVAVPSYADLDKFMQVFDKESVNQTFTDIQIKSVSKTEQDSGQVIKAKIQVKHRLDFIRNNPNVLVPVSGGSNTSSSTPVNNTNVNGVTPTVPVQNQSPTGQ